MPKSMSHPLASKEIGDASSQSPASVFEARRPRKTPLNRKGMSPQKLLDATGILSHQALDVIEQAIEEGCGRVQSHRES